MSSLHTGVLIGYPIMDDDNPQYIRCIAHIIINTILIGPIRLTIYVLLMVISLYEYIYILYWAIYIYICVCVIDVCS